MDRWIDRFLQNKRAKLLPNSLWKPQKFSDFLFLQQLTCLSFLVIYPWTNFIHLLLQSLLPIISTIYLFRLLQFSFLLWQIVFSKDCHHSISHPTSASFKQYCALGFNSWLISFSCSTCLKQSHLLSSLGLISILMAPKSLALILIFKLL